MLKPINVFIIYAREDKDIKQRLLRHLNPLKDAYNINIWHDEYIEAGQEWKPHIESRLEITDLFILLVSADFMDSEFIHQVEFKFAIDRHKQKKSIIIPVIINYCLWDIDIKYPDYTFNLNELQVLPPEGKPVDDWKTADQAFNNIAGGIRKVLSTIRNKTEQAERGENKNTQADNQPNENTGPLNQQQLKPENERNDLLQKEILQQQIKKEERERSAPFIHQETPIDKPLFSKKTLYISIALAATILLSYLIFHKNSNPGKADQNNVDTTNLTVKNLQTDTMSGIADVTGKKASKAKDSSKVDPTQFTPPKVVKDAEVGNPKEESVDKVNDIDGNTYDVVTIGKQTWMKQNLKTTHYRNGATLPNVTGNTQWANLSNGAYCNLNNDASNANTYGLLYNWYAVNNSAGLCPLGWHIPTSGEWNTLVNFLGGYDVAGTALKAKILWSNYGEVPDSHTNSSGFDGIPAGERWAKGDFANGNWAYIWSSSFNSIELNGSNPKAYLQTSPNQTEQSGYSCRCIRN